MNTKNKQDQTKKNGRQMARQAQGAKGPKLQEHELPEMRLTR